HLGELFRVKGLSTRLFRQLSQQSLGLSLFALLKQTALLVQIAGKPDKVNQSVSLAQVIDDFAELIVTVLVQPVGHQDNRLAPVLPLFAGVIGSQVERV